MSFILRPSRPDDAPAVAAVHNAQNEPDQHLTSQQLLDHDASFRRADPAFRRLVAEVDGEVVATGTVRSRWTGPAEDGRLWALVHVRRDHRGRGLDSELLDALLASTPIVAREVLTCIREDFLESADFLEPHGFVEAFRSWGAHLDPTRFDAQRFAPWIAHLERSGVRLVAYRELPPTFDRDVRLVALQRELEGEAASFPPIVPRTFEDVTDADAVLETAYVALTTEGRPVGITHLVRWGRNGALAVAFTGVVADLRRRGIGTALEARAVEAALALGCSEVNAGGGGSLDAPIVRLHRSLGFEVEPGWVTLARRR